MEIREGIAKRMEARIKRREVVRQAGIIRLEGELSREHTDEDRTKYKREETALLREAYIVVPQVRENSTLRGGLSAEDVHAYQREVEELNNLSPQEIDWRIKRNIRDRLESLRTKPL